MQQPVAMWNSVRGVWEKVGMANLFCEHWELYSVTWPTSGMTQNGLVFELPMQERLTADSEFLSLPTLPTPIVSDGTGGSKNIGNSDFSPQMRDIVKLLPTTAARDYKDGTAPHERNGEVQTDTVARAIFNSGEVTNTNWGKFEPAIHRWEETLGRPAPAPTKPDGKDGAHRLSSKFTEWMMGLPDGWITDCGLTRNEELKACGNGVVPQQAELALRILLEGVSLPEIGGQVNLPTPTVSDIFTSSLKSSQQKEGSMHSVTLPQAVERLGVELEKATSESL